MSSLDIMKFIREEITRQGWTPGSPDFYVRVGAMAAAWNDARFWNKAEVTLWDDAGVTLGKDAMLYTLALRWGMMVEPETNFHGWRRVGVQVGGHVAPPPEEVPTLMARWAELSKTMTADEAYIAFEKIHPFGDGNGRTGKIIHNWLLGTLDEPVLIKDYFGGGLP